MFDSLAGGILPTTILASLAGLVFTLVRRQIVAVILTAAAAVAISYLWFHLPEILWRDPYRYRVVDMTRHRKLTASELEQHLKAEAHDPDAWEYVTTVSAGTSPRPSWYGRSNQLELAAKFYVLSVLHRMGAEANLTTAQRDTVDIAAVRQSGEAFTIDVKTLSGTTEWAVDQFRARKHHFVVFVCFSADAQDPDLTPELFIWDSQSLKSALGGWRTPKVSLTEIAAKHDAKVAWGQFTTDKPAA